MLGHPQLRWHDLDDLLPAVAYDLCRVERGAAAPALSRPVLDHTGRPLTEPERLPNVPDLTSRLPA